LYTSIDPRSRWERRFEAWLKQYLPGTSEQRHALKIRIFRLLALTNIVLGLYYFSFRYTASLNPYALWIAIPLLIAETYSFIDTLLFIFMMWQPKRRPDPPPLYNCKVDVFIATYSEPISLVRQTAEAALKIRYPHQTYVLDDGNRPDLQAICEEIGCAYITRGQEWEGRPRHAKAGNIINALTRTSGDFILILDADQIPAPDILDRTLGYFTEPQVAFVQTPQWFYNVPQGDPFGSQAPLFYGPIQQGKDGWNAAFFCGSNAVLRREALKQLGLVTFVLETEDRLKQALNRIPLVIHTKKRHLPPKQRQAAEQIAQAAEIAVIALREAQQPMAEVLDTFDRAIETARRDIIADSLANIQRDLAEIEALSAGQVVSLPETLAGVQTGTTPSPLASLHHEIEQGMLQLEARNLGLEKLLEQIRFQIREAVLDQPLATFSITEDMATAMRLHALGWQSVFHTEVLAYGLAPEDLASALGQRLRWAAGTIQVLIHENPLLKPGLSWPQRLQYFTTIYSYFSGFVSPIYLAAPIIYLFSGIAPINSFAGEFLWRITPYLVINKLLFKLVAWGIDVRRGEQYSLALFPLWIQAILTVFSGQKLAFKVTPKTRQSGIYLNLVIPQLVITLLLVCGCFYAVFGLLVGWRNDLVGVLVNIFWACYDIWMLSVILRAAVYRPPVEEPD
jgi:cellulose synthase (UDP-forming)